MAGYKLKLNPDKTEFIVFGPKQNRDSLLKFFPVVILGNKISPTKSQLNYSFDYIAPRNWNSLPDIVRLAPSVPTFRNRLKTYLFWQAFSPP